MKNLGRIGILLALPLVLLVGCDSRGIGGENENNQNLNLPQGAGIQAAQNVLQHKPQVVLTGNCGPKAFKVLRAGGVEVVVGVEGKIREVVKDYMAGAYSTAGQANVEGHWV